MASINKAILIGNLGADPDVRYTTEGTAVGNFNMATNERWKDKNGQPQERTEWHRIVVWGKQAELCREYLSKGRTVYIEGRLQTRKWEDKQGQTRYTTEIVAQTIQFLGGRPSARDQSTDTSTDTSVDTPSTGSTEGPPQFNSEEDIPF